MIRQATPNDLSQIAAVHVKCFPDNFSTALGKFGGGYLQRRFYWEYMKDNPELFLVAEDEQKQIIGFCMGYYRSKTDHMKLFYKHNAIPIALQMLFLLLSFNKQAWLKIRQIAKKEAQFKRTDDRVKIDPRTAGDLLSICVLPEYRGMGVAQKLLENYEAVLTDRNMELCLLAVSVENGRGIRFYERNGYIPYMEKLGQARAT